MSKRDVIKQPSHYVEGRKYEPKDVIRDWGLNFNLGNAVKYIARAGRKDDIVQDLKKAQEYIQFEIEAIEAERAKEVKPKTPNHPNCRCVSKGHDDRLDTILYGLDPIMRAIVEAEACSVKPIIVKFPEDVDPEEFIKMVTGTGKILHTPDEESKAEIKKVQEMLHSKEPKCTFNPVFADTEDGKGVCVGTLEVTVPAGADPEDIIKAVIETVYSGSI